MQCLEANFATETMYLHPSMMAIGEHVIKLNGLVKSIERIVEHKTKSRFLNNGYLRLPLTFPRGESRFADLGHFILHILPTIYKDIRHLRVDFDLLSLLTSGPDPAVGKLISLEILKSNREIGQVPLGNDLRLLMSVPPKDAVSVRRTWSGLKT